MSATTPTLITTLLLALTANGFVIKPTPECPPGDALSWMADPDDCSLFYVCHASTRFDMNCGVNVWNQDLKTCVGKGSQWDTCKLKKKNRETIFCNKLHKNGRRLHKQKACLCAFRKFI
jgi:hypothetical protein